MNNYPTYNFHYCIDDYKFPSDPENWDECPKCKLKPKIWQFNNGMSTACGCWESRYDHFSIHAESIMSVVNRCGNTIDYNSDELKNNWNHYCKTGEELFIHAGKRTDGRW